MMSAIFSFMIVAGFLLAALTGRMEFVNASLLDDAQKAVTLTISLVGAYCFWGGLCEIARQSGLTDWLAKAMSPVTRHIFSNIHPRGQAMGAISMNIAANLLGLGNAATPLGITAMREMQREQRSGSRATNDMALFVVLNTASIQLIPTTTAVLRGIAGAEQPLDILPAVWLASLFSLLIGIFAAKLLEKLWR